MNIVGIDPGKNGGIAFRKNYIIDAVPMPLKKGTIDGSAIANLLIRIEPKIILIEEIFSRTGISSPSSMLTFGKGFGVIEGVIQAFSVTAFDIDLYTVNTKKWKEDILGDESKNKQLAIDYVKAKHPNINLQPGKTKTDQDGIADAVCILDYAIKEYDLESIPYFPTLPPQIKGVSIE